MLQPRSRRVGAAARCLALSALVAACGGDPAKPAGSGTDAIDTSGGATDGTVVPDSAADTAVDTSQPWEPSCPSGIGCACANPTECDVPLCLETPAGPRCSTWCGDGICPPGWSCQGQKGGRDATYFCIPDGGLLCRPCQADLDCQAAGHAGARCVAYGESGGFCGLKCGKDADCPGEYECRELPSVQDGVVTKQCALRPAPGSPSGALGACTCSPHAKAQELATSCWVVSGSGAEATRCLGSRNCAAGGLTPCTEVKGSEAKCLDVQCLDAKTGLPLADGAACNDGRACTQGDVCKSGTCQSGAQSCPCEPGFKDCAEAGASNLCKGPLICEASGRSSGAPFACVANTALAKDCDDSLDDPCLRNACVPLSGACTMTASERTAEVCDMPAGSDGKPGCRREVKASNLPDDPAVACDDGLACSVGESCAKGACQGADMAACKCLKDSDCQDDGDKCNGLPYCDKGDGKADWTCKINPSTVVTCDTSGDAGCMTTACAAKTGACVKDFAPSGTACSDGVACTQGDVCDNQGTCQPGTWTCCKADADCAKDEDGNACNGTLFCNKAAGACQLNPATVVSCPTVADTACAKAGCDGKTGLCIAIPVADKSACQDGDPCTDGDACAGGACKAGTDICSCLSDADCKAKDDGDLCNGTLYCNKAIGKCKLNPATAITCPSVDDTACRKNTCQPLTGACKAIDLPAKVTCDADGTGCTQSDACDGQGACVAGTAVCVCQADVDCAGYEDGDVCNGTLYCDKSGPTPACKLNPKTVKVCPSVDDTACVKNQCQAKTGQCAMTLQPIGAPCSDGKACTGGDGCDSKGACLPGPVVLCGCKADGDCKVFDDGDVCNGGFVCQGGACAFDAKVMSCDDGNACTTDSCDKAAGCQHQAKAGCAACQQASDCDDANTCTADACDKGACGHVVYAGKPCNDGDVCSLADECSATGACVAGTVKDCGDSNPCTDDSCDAKSGCVSAANTKACDADGSVCTEGDQCSGSVCKAGTAKNCDDSNPCTDDSCPSKSGCVYAANTKVCDDGSVCTEGDQCGGSVCKAGAAKKCDDTNPCTDDTCDGKSGCVYAANTKACDADGSVCTEGDQCSGSACKAGAAKKCDDAKLCTDDSCDAKSGCAFAAKKCDDGNDCTTDSCEEQSGCTYAPALEGALCKGENSACLAGTCVDRDWSQDKLVESEAEASFTINADGTFVDNNTKLVWQKDVSATTYKWEQALAYCKALVLPMPTGKGWRLPTRMELETLVAPARYNPATWPVLAALTPSASFWSSTRWVDSIGAAPSSGNAWVVGFSNGTANYNGVTSAYRVRCVR